MADKVFTKGLFANEKGGQYGSFFNIDFKTDEFIEWMKANTNDKGYCKITLYKNKEGSASKNTHYGCLNDYVKPETNDPAPGPQGKMQEPQVKDEINPDDLPF